MCRDAVLAAFLRCRGHLPMVAGGVHGNNGGDGGQEMVELAPQDHMENENYEEQGENLYDVAL